MSRYTRLTLLGAHQRADVVVPSEECLGAMLPDLLDLLDERAEDLPRSVALVRVTGEQLDLAHSCADQEVPDGEVLRVERSADAPPPPDVADVTDATAEELDTRRDRWTEGSRQVLGVVVAGLAAAAAGLAAFGTGAQPRTGAALPTLGAASVAALLAAAGLGRARRPYAGLVATAAAVGLAPAVALAGLSQLAPSVAARLGLVLLWAALLAGAGVGRGSRGALAGGAAGIGLTVLAAGLEVLLPAVPAAAVLAALVALAAGLLPWYAMTTSGLTGLDDQALDDGAAPPVRRVRRTLAEAYSSLTWSAVAVAVAAVPATVTLVTSGSGGAVVLGFLVVAVLALRTRTLPLRRQVLALWAAVVVPLAAFLLGPVADRAWALAAGLAAVGGLVFAVAAGTRPTGRQRARLRRTGDTVELLCVLAILPVLLGVLGVYGQLLEVF